MADMEIFYAGKGINVQKLNANFANLQTQANKNESDIQTLANTALLKDGSNLTPDLVEAFKADSVLTIEGHGTLNLSDGGDYNITLNGDANIVLPTVTNDDQSHTITVMVMGSDYSLNLGTTHAMMSVDVITTRPYSVLYVYNKIDGNWYYYLGQ